VPVFLYVTILTQPRGHCPKAGDQFLLIVTTDFVIPEKEHHPGENRARSQAGANLLRRVEDWISAAP
jgi:hypothetical protein